MTNWISTGQAARLLGVSPSTVRRYCSNRQLNYYRTTPTAQRRIELSSVLALQIPDGSGNPSEGNASTAQPEPSGHDPECPLCGPCTTDDRCYCCRQGG